MNTQIISALIGAGATIISVILAFILNQIAKRISDKRFRKKHNIRDISGDWKSKWIYVNENGDENIIECLDNIRMKGKNCFEGKSERKEWHYSIAGTIDEMGYLSGTWDSLIDTYKDSFLLKLRPSLKYIEGHTLSVSFEHDTRPGRWVWERRS